MEALWSSEHKTRRARSGGRKEAISAWELAVNQVAWYTVAYDYGRLDSCVSRVAIVGARRRDGGVR